MAGNSAPLTPQYLRSTLNQVGVTLIIAPIAFLLAGTDGVIAVTSGAACLVLPQAFFALRMQRAASASAQRAARLGLAAEGGKFLLSAASFALVFAVLKPERPGLVFLGFGVLLLVQFVDSARILARVGSETLTDSNNRE